MPGFTNNNEIGAKLYGEDIAQLPLDLYIPPEALEVYLESFEGPLDLLLYLIEKITSMCLIFLWLI